MKDKEYKNILFEIEGDRAVLAINRPPVNILNIATMEEMNDAISSLKGNTTVKVLVITSTGEKAFSAGVDVADHTEDKAEEMIRVFHSIFRSLLSLEQVTVAACKGLTLGGGCEVAIFCDLILAAELGERGRSQRDVERRLWRAGGLGVKIFAHGSKCYSRWVRLAFNSDSAPAFVNLSEINTI